MGIDSDSFIATRYSRKIGQRSRDSEAHRLPFVKKDCAVSQEGRAISSRRAIERRRRGGERWRGRENFTCHLRTSGNMRFSVRWMESDGEQVVGKLGMGMECGRSAGEDREGGRGWRELRRQSAT